MALQPVGPDNAGMWTIRGVTADTSVLAPLGRLWWKIGAHYVGVDDSFREPAIVRAYYDPSQDASLRTVPSDAVYAGYMQFVQVRFAGQPVPPQSYGGHLADRWPYAAADDFWFVDFMGPAQAAARVDNTKTLDPFYAFNGALLDGTIRGFRDLASYPRRNGVVLLGSSTGSVPNQALCASLVAELAPGLLTEAHIASLLNDDNYLRTIQGDLARNEAFAIALADMQQRGELPGLGYSDINGRVVGKYALIELPNEENMPPSICVHVQDGAVVIHVIAYHELESAEKTAVMDSLQRMAEYVEDNGMDDTGLPPPRSGRGNGGLNALPSRVDRSGNIVEWHYTTILFAKRPQRQTRENPYADLWLMHGFSWSALQTFDSDARALAFHSIKAPQELSSFKSEPALRQYFTTIAGCVANPSAAPDIDLSNFTLAGMRLLNLGDASIKLHALDSNGTLANKPDGSPVG